MAAGTKYEEQKWVWSLVNVDDFGGWRQNCNDQRVLETKNRNGMEWILLFSLVDRMKSKPIHE
jgi:hypothetical protein